MNIISYKLRKMLLYFKNINKNIYDLNLMPWMWINEKRKIVYFETPKVCSTTIKRAVIKHQGKKCEYYIRRGINKYKKQYDSYFKFGFVRNPWSRVVSNYYMCLDLPNKTGFRPKNFREFVEKICSGEWKNHHWEKQIFFIPVDKIKLDFIGRFEHFNEDWRQVEKQFKKYDPDFKYSEKYIQSSTDTIPHLMPNLKQRHKKYNYKELYKDDPVLISMIREHYNEDIKFFHYEF